MTVTSKSKPSLPLPPVSYCKPPGGGPAVLMKIAPHELMVCKAHSRVCLRFHLGDDECYRVADMQFDHQWSVYGHFDFGNEKMLPAGGGMT